MAVTIEQITALDNHRVHVRYTSASSTSEEIVGTLRRPIDRDTRWSVGDRRLDVADIQYIASLDDSE